MSNSIKNFIVTLKKSGESKDRLFSAVITSDSLDRDNEVLLPMGCDASEFLKQPTLFYNHDYSLPIGKALKLSKSNNSWTMDAQIASRPADYQGDFFADEIWALIDQGIIKGISVGFQTKERRNPTKKDFDMYGQNVSNVVTKWSLMEVSIAPLQSNPDAVIYSVSKGLITVDTVKRFYPDFEMPKKKFVISFVPKNFSQKKELEVAQKQLKDVKNEMNIQMKKLKGQLYSD